MLTGFPASLLYIFLIFSHHFIAGSLWCQYIFPISLWYLTCHLLLLTIFVTVVLFFISIQSTWTTVSKNLAKSVWQELPLPLPHLIPLHIWQDTSSSITSLVITDHPCLCSSKLLLLGPCSQNTLDPSCSFLVVFHPLTFILLFWP